MIEKAAPEQVTAVFDRAEGKRERVLFDMAMRWELDAV